MGAVFAHLCTNRSQVVPYLRRIKRSQGKLELPPIHPFFHQCEVEGERQLDGAKACESFLEVDFEHARFARDGCVKI